MVRNTKFQDRWNHVVESLFRCLRFSPKSCQFPEDLLFEIFMWLPVKSLLRFRCVSKSLRAMIDSKVFIEEHSRRSLKTKCDFQLIFTRPWEQPYYVDFGNGNSSIARVLEHPCYSNQSVIVGCFNGIICLWDYCYMPESYILWNPSTRKYKKIEFLPHGSDHVPLSYLVTSGFGYDHANDDYKIVRMDKSKSPYEIQVYSLKSNYWRKFEIQVPVGKFDQFYVTNAFVRGAVHWLWTSTLGENKIAAFHLESGNFSFLPLPPRLKSTGLTLTDLGDDLCIIGHSLLPRNCSSKLAIWVMEEYGNKDSWKTFDMDIKTISFTLPNFNRKLSRNHTIPFFRLGRGKNSTNRKRSRKFTIPFFPVGRGKLIAFDILQSQWFLIDIQQLESITSRDLLMHYSSMCYGDYKLYLCCNSLVQI